MTAPRRLGSLEAKGGVAIIGDPRPRGKSARYFSPARGPLPSSPPRDLPGQRQSLFAVAHRAIQEGDPDARQRSADGWPANSNRHQIVATDGELCAGDLGGRSAGFDAAGSVEPRPEERAAPRRRHRRGRRRWSRVPWRARSCGATRPAPSEMQRSSPRPHPSPRADAEPAGAARHPGGPSTPSARSTHGRRRAASQGGSAIARPSRRSGATDSEGSVRPGSRAASTCQSASRRSAREGSSP